MEQEEKVLGKALALPVPGQAKMVLVRIEQPGDWPREPGAKGMKVSLRRRE
jgi:hypothetical protein